MSEVRFARLLRLYPADHPRDEMLDVLLAGGAPVRREALPLVLGGLRARCGGHQPPRERWLYAARAAALMLLLLSALQPVPDKLPSHGWPLAAWIAAMLAAVAVTVGGRRPAVVLAVAAFALTTVDGSVRSAVVDYSLICVLLLIPGPRTPVASPIPWALALLGTSGDAPTWLFFVVLAGVVVWAVVVDERILTAVGLALLIVLIEGIDHLTLLLSTPGVGGEAPDLIQRTMLPGIALPAVPLAVGALIALRRNSV